MREHLIYQGIVAVFFAVLQIRFFFIDLSFFPIFPFQNTGKKILKEKLQLFDIKPSTEIKFLYFVIDSGNNSFIIVFLEIWEFLKTAI